MYYAQEISDLCTTCNHQADCISRATLIRPVLFCEEFTCEAPLQDRRPAFTLREISATSHPPINPPYSGICVNCEDREVCVSARRKQNIQFCEEYR
jgi:hypothetical protein